MAQTRAKKSQSNHHQGQSKAITDAKVVIEPPEGIVLDGNAEKTVWDQFVATRATSDWRPFDLVMLAKVVKLEVQLRDAQAMLKKTGLVISNKRGTPVANPLVVVTDTLTRQQMTIIRGMGILATGIDSRTIAKQGQDQAGAKKLIEEDETLQLFATPKE